MKNKELEIPFRGLFETSRKGLFIFLAALTLCRWFIVGISGLELSGDEAHYWQWSQRLDWCYYSKPPGVAVFIWLGTHVFGNTELGVRCLAGVLSFAASAMMFLLGRRLYNEKAGIAAAVLLQAMPLFSAFGVGMTPDTPLIFFWICSLYLFHRAWSDNRAIHWLGLSCSLGLGLLSKYAIVFFYIPAILFLVSTPLGRKRLRTFWPYLSFILSFAFFIPVLYWNSQHDWVMFRHDIGHASLNKPTTFAPADFFNFLLGQMGMVTPVAFAVILILLIKKRRECGFCFWFSVPILVGFLLKSATGKIQPNWPMVAWIAGLFPLADLMVNGYRELKRRRQLGVNWAVGIAAYAAIGLHLLPFIIMQVLPLLIMCWPWLEKNNPTRKLVGWRDLGRQVSAIRETMEEPCFIFSNYYMVASELAFYLDDQPFVYCENFGTRMNQYDVWPGFADRVGHNAIFVMKVKWDESRTIPGYPKVKDAFERIDTEDVIIHDHHGSVLHRYKIFRCYGLKQWERNTPQTY